MSFKEFFKSRQFLIQIGLLIVFFIVAVYLTLIFLRLYTHQGQSLPVPDFNGLTEYEVQSVVQEKKLRYQIVDSVYIYEAVPGTIVVQHPPAGFHVKKNRTIYLTISAISPEQVILPQVVDVSLREAKSRLENAGLRLGQVEYRPSEFFNLVLGQRLNGKYLPADTMLNKGTPVDLIVGRGLSNERTEVPSLIGLYISEARDTLYELSLTLGVLLFDRSVQNATDSLNAMIWRQNPAHSPGRLVELGTSIDVWLTVDYSIIDSLIETEIILEEDFEFDEDGFF